MDEFRELLMWLLGMALVMTALKYLAIGPVAQWSWWWVLVPYGLTVAWWTYADISGLTQRRAEAHDEARKHKRLQRQKQALRMQRRR